MENFSIMNDDSTFGIIENRFLNDDDTKSVYEAVSSRGFNTLMKVKRQGRWFILKGLAAEYRNQAIYLELLKEIDSPLLDDPKTADEFRNAWENLHNDKYNMVAFRLNDKIQEELGKQ